MSKQIIAISMGEAEPRLNRDTIMNMFSVQGFELIDDERWDIVQTDSEYSLKRFRQAWLAE